MVKKIIAKFEVEYLQVLKHNGRFYPNLIPKLPESDIQKMYELMLLSRKLDEKMLALQRQGKIGTFAPVKGQEASTVGSAYAMGYQDWFFPSFRENPAYITRGLPAEFTLLYHGGDERGNQITPGVNAFPIAVPVGSQTLHAVGFAYGLRLQGKDSACITYFGDGATSEGDVNEAMNFAGVFNLPVVFICQNNQYAISLSRKNQTNAETIAQRAIGFGIKGIQVDGNDIFAVYRATKEALERARNDEGPTLIECVTYRMADHTTADDSSRYRSSREVSFWKKRDPLLRLELYMLKKKIQNYNYFDDIEDVISERVESIVARGESYPPPNVEDIFKFTYKEMPWFLKEQLEELKKTIK
ncbi:pyruvate dehydrogenase (acetyl-transferring) E1 component subunit alpha [archaeon]|nr:pyruvate dehydrogenase (acetyl-transferring) E1 component subunit alpha [archaeon]|tara:strand:+ start:7438 stop:8508 length:1071 start_codon:yes stop_codon:yes gene_type:complete